MTRTTLRSLNFDHIYYKCAFSSGCLIFSYITYYIVLSSCSLCIFRNMHMLLGMLCVPWICIRFLYKLHQSPFAARLYKCTTSTDPAGFMCWITHSTHLPHLLAAYKFNENLFLSLDSMTWNLVFTCTYGFYTKLSGNCKSCQSFC